MNAVLDAALGYVERGWAVFPLGSGKLPLPNCPDCRPDTGDCPGRDACTCTRGTRHAFYSATTDPARIVDWYGRQGHTGVGIRTGKPSGLVVLDVDGDAGTRSLAELDERVGVLPGTLMQITGAGALHLIYGWPDHPVPPSAGKLGPGLDVRGDGSYIVAAPTRHPRTGLPYTWFGGEFRSEPTPWPAALDELLQPTPGVPVAQPTAVPLTLAVLVGRIAGALEFLLAAPAGERNGRFFWTACRFAQWVAEGLMVSQAEAYDALLTAAQAIGLPEREARATISSAMRSTLRGAA